MILRPRQQDLVQRALHALHQNDNTLCVAPTGAGKTVMLSAITADFLKHPNRKACILAHRDELTAQNRDKFKRVNPHLSTSVYDASEKSWQGSATFAMVQTLSRDHNLETLPSLDLLVIDEAHHARADSYMRVIEGAKKRNPLIKILGMTATANRGDKRGLYPIFSNVADQITIEELIASGHLVPPKTFIIDVGIQEALKQLKKKKTGDYDDGEVSSIMNTLPVNDAVVQTWKEKAHNRQTVVFCSTLQHGRDVRESFIRAGIACVMVDGEMGDQEREQTLFAYTSGAARVIVNVAVLTEGWDDPPTSCVILLRLSSYKSTMIQMIGRGLRIASPDEYPHVHKTDCLVLDFGISTFFHGSLEDQINLLGREPTPGEACTKSCPECGGEVPLAVHECPLCGYDFRATATDEQDARKPLTREEFVMQEIELIKKRSPFMWIRPPEKESKVLLANGFNVWSGAFFYNGQWVALGAFKKQPARILATGEQNVCLSAANDFMNLHESEQTAHKSKDWVYLPPSEAQLKWIPEYRDRKINRYEAGGLMTLKFSKKHIMDALKESTHG
ncbi:ATP-dependent RNA helicase DbpA [Caedimonas varicaedens]|uniref:ATP-dependent RNA helicase DbpA n=1 Tax=Caedimonas varicaedens TaxID=1629334 RepID=A0A0K8MC31_9PROT|nr:ATP-dependent RNA helicase DbpA [Caedimonas varicaedens]